MQLSMKMCVIPILLGMVSLLAFGILSSVFGNQLQILFMALLPVGWMLIFAGIFIGVMYLSHVAVNPIRFRQHRHFH